MFYNLIYSGNIRTNTSDSHLKNCHISKDVGSIIPEKSFIFKQPPYISHFKTFTRAAYRKTRGFDIRQKKAVDKDIIYKLEEITKFKFIAKPLYYYRQHSKGISQGKNVFTAKYYNYMAKYNTYLRRRNTDLPNFSKFKINFEYLKIIFYRFIEYKNLDNLIESFKNVADFSLDIIGEGKLKLRLDQKIKDLKLQDKIKFLGVFPNSELPRILNQYNIFILPSFTEGNPKALLEAMSCGIACIGSNIPGINQIIKHKKNGYLCNFDSLSIANAIKEINGDPILREELGKKAREFVVNNCSLEKIVEKELKIYKSILNQV